MAQSISRMVLAGATLLAGCGSGVGGGAVSDNPYVVCNAGGFTDQFVTASLRRLRLLRDDGYSVTKALEEGPGNCSMNPDVRFSRFTLLHTA